MVGAAGGPVTRQESPGGGTLAVRYQDQGFYEKAEPLFVPALAIEEPLQGVPIQPSRPRSIAMPRCCGTCTGRSRQPKSRRELNPCPASASV